MSSHATDGAPHTEVPGTEASGEIISQEVPEHVPEDVPEAPASASPEDKAPGDEGPGEWDYDYEVPGERAPVSKLAVVALITGILPLVPLAVITGITSLFVIRRSGRRGHGLAVAALVGAAAWVIAGGAVGTVGYLTHGFKKPEQTAYNEASVFRLQEGDCIDTPNGQQVSVLPCTSPHDAEVFATFSLPGTTWPGSATVAQEASSGCAARLTSYLNPQLSISLSQTYVYPNNADWMAGTRTVICEVRAASGQLTQSVRGSG